MPVLTNIRYELFAQALAEGYSVVDAHKMAGFKENRGNASRLNAHEGVRARVREILGEAADKNGITVEALVRELANIALFDVGDVVEWGTDKPPPKASLKVKLRDPNFVRLKDGKGLPPRLRRCIAKVSKTAYGVTVQPYDKLAAIRLLGSHLGMWKDKEDDKTGSDALVDLIVQAHRRSQGGDAKVIEGTSE